MSRWLLLPLGLGLTAVAVYLLAAGGPPPAQGIAPPLDDIDPASRARLERVLERAERSP